MDDLAFLRERIESYADYTNDVDAHLSDGQIRAYVGEALARVAERLAPSGPAGEALARVLLRCQFADQQVVRALDGDVVAATEVRRVHAADRALVTLADRADALTSADVAAYVAEVSAALDHRSQIVLAAETAPRVPPR